MSGSSPAPILRLPLGFVNAWLARTDGGGFVLVDTGTPGDWARLTAGLAAAGCTKETLRLVVITHGDFDHVGCAKRLRSEWGVPVAAHRGDLGLMARGESPARRGATPLLRLLMRLLPQRKADPDAPGSPLFMPDLLLEEGQRLDAYGWDATVLHTPGHTAGGIAILTAQGDLLVGDTARGGARPGVGMLVQDADAYDATLARLSALPGAVAVHPGHGNSFPAARLPGRLPDAARPKRN